MRVQDVDLTNRVVNANILPIPHGDLVGSKAGEMSESLRIEISSAGVTTSVPTYPEESIVDPTAMTLSLDRGDSDYPFADFQLSVENDWTGEGVPFVADMENSARPWVFSGSIGSAIRDGGKYVYPVALEGHRDPLSVTLVSFYVITTLMAVVTIGSTFLRRSLEFSNVIWLSARPCCRFWTCVPRCPAPRRSASP